MAKISIIIPIYNIEDYICEAIQSILNQTYEDFELILINDGSTDHSFKLAKQTSGNDPRVTYITQPNKGLSATRNKGIKVATSDYIYFFDGDDLLEPNTIEICLKWAYAEQLDLICFSGKAFLDSSQKDFDINDYKHYLKPNLLAPQSGEHLYLALEKQGAYSSSACLYICSLKLIKQNFLKFDEGFLHEDESFTTEVYCLATKAISLQDTFFKRRIRPKSIMTAPHTFKNIQGYIQAVKIINNSLIKKSIIKSTTKEKLRLKQRIFLRSARTKAEKLNMQRQFSTLLARELPTNDILYIDPLMLLYIHAYKIYQLMKYLSQNKYLKLIFSASKKL